MAEAVGSRESRSDLSPVDLPPPPPPPPAPPDAELVLAERSLRSAFQPIFDLVRQEPIGYEALARFPGSSEVSPRQWFDQASTSGLLHAFEVLAAETALDNLPHIPDHAFISVNVSPGTAASKSFADLAATVPPGRLVIEISERSLSGSYGFSSAAIENLRGSGVRVAVDDVGESDVSLRRLAEVRADILKIDMSVIRGVGKDDLKRAVVSAYAALAESTGALALAEGIEDEEDLGALLSIGLRAGQGYLLGHPVFWTE